MAFGDGICRILSFLSSVGSLGLFMLSSVRHWAIAANSIMCSINGAQFL
jgi:hypothetical protein